MSESCLGLLMKYPGRSGTHNASRGRQRGQDGFAHIFTPACSLHRVGGSDDSDPTKPRRHGTSNVTAGPRGRRPGRGPRSVRYLIGVAVLLACTSCDNAGKSAADHPQASASTTANASPASPSVPPSPTGANLLIKAESDLRAAQARYYSAYMAAVAKPNNAQVVDRLLGLYTEDSPARRSMKRYVKTLAVNGFAGRPGRESGFSVKSVQVSSVAEGATAKVMVCTYDDGVTYDTRHDGPDGKPIIIDDSVSSASTRFRYSLQAGKWKLTGGEVVKTWAGENHCSATT